MDHLKEAYEKLGLPETASREELEERYTLLMKKARSEQRRDPSKAEEIEARFAEETKAYKYILDEEKRRSLEEISRQKYGKYKGMAGFVEKTEHFFRYYRFHLLGALALVGILIYAVISFFNYRAEQERLASLPPIDLSVMFLGEFAATSENQGVEELEAAILSQFPEWKRVSVNITYVPPLDSSNPQDAAMLQKAMVMLSTERPDLYIMDQTSFNWIGHQGITRSLETELEGSFKNLVTPEMLVSTKLEDETEEKVYAVDVISSPLSDQLPLIKQKQNMMAGVREDSENEDNAVLFIQRYLESAQTDSP